MSEDSGKAPASRRRWLYHLLFLPLVAIMAAFLTVVVWFVVAYQQLAGELQSSHKRVPTSVSTALAPAGEIVDEPQVTLAVASPGNRHGTAGLAFRTDPEQRTLSLLSLPTTTQDVDDSTLIRSAGGVIGGPVNHVIIVSPRSLREIVDKLGPLTIANPSPVDYILENGRYVHFPAGDIVLDGTRALAFMNGTGETTTVAREQLILERIVDTLLTPKTVSELADTTRSVASSADTDLAPSDLVGLAWVRFHSDAIIRCRMTGPNELETAVTDAERKVFLGQTSLASDAQLHGCRSRPLGESSLPLPPKSVIKVVGAAYPFWRIALAILVGCLVLLVAFLLRGPLWAGISGVARSLHPERLWNAARAVRVRRPSLPRPQSIGSLRSNRAHTVDEPRASASALAGLREGWGRVGRGVPSWAIRNRGDIGVYVLVTALAVGITFLILLSAG